MNEAFRGGFAATAAEKIAKIMSKRTGGNFSVSATPIEYKDSYGSFASYVALSKNMAYKLNFLLSNSDYIESVDVFFGPGNILDPDISVAFDSQDNIVNIVNTIESLLKGEPIDEKKKPSLRVAVELNEIRRSAGQETVWDWIEEDRRNLDIIQNKRLSQAINDFYNWAANNNRLQVSQPTFNTAVKNYLKDHNMVNKFLKAGSKRKSQKGNLLIDPSTEADFDDALQMNAEQQEEAIQKFMDILAKGYYKAMLITGRPGIGKSTLILRYAKTLNLPSEIVSGGVSSAKDLYRYLFRHKDNELLIFDDIDDVLLSKPMQRMLKSVLDMSFDKGHVITYLDKEFVPPDRYDAMTPKQQDKNTPNRYTFSSRIIFISNSDRKKFDSAVIDRSLNIDFDLSNEEVLQKLKDNVDEFMPTIDKKVKLTVLDWLSQNFDMFKQISYRHFYKAVVFADTGSPDWSNWAFADIAAS